MAKGKTSVETTNRNRTMQHGYVLQVYKGDSYEAGELFFETGPLVDVNRMADVWESIGKAFPRPEYTVRVWRQETTRDRVFGIFRG